MKPKVIIVAVIVSIVALFSYTACEIKPAPPGFVGNWVHEEDLYDSDYKGVITLTLTENSLQLIAVLAGEGYYGYFKIVMFGIRANIEVSGDTMNLTVTELYSSYYEDWIDNTDPYWDYYYYDYTGSIIWTFNIEGDTLTLDDGYDTIVFTRQ